MSVWDFGVKLIEFVGGLLPSKKAAPEPEPVDAEKARAGAESGAAATHAGRIAGHEQEVHRR